MKLFLRKYGLIVLMLMAIRPLQAQEFRASVSINSQKLQSSAQQFESSDNKIFETMKQTIEDFVNLRRWTNLEFEQQEKLDCSISIVLSQRNSATDFVGQLSVQLRRPVYNSNYTTGLFNYLEGPSDLAFSFNESQPLEFEANSYYDILSSTIAFYLYELLGLYFDSFAPMGGDPFYEVARDIQQTVTSNNPDARGWQSKHGIKARYWFMENATNPTFQPARKAFYDYHRLGLDMMTKDQTAARASIVSALKSLQQVHSDNRNDLLVTQFVDVKMDEIVAIFTPATEEEKRAVFEAVKAITPLNISKLKNWNIK